MLSLASRVAMVEREAGMHPAMGGLVEASNRYAAWFHELDAWTQYWDIYHPETNGRYHFGNGTTEPGLLRTFLRREQRPAAFNAWVRMALALDGRGKFVEEAREPEVAAAVLEVDRLVSRLFKQHFGDASNPGVQADYINAMLCFGCDTLPGVERHQRLQQEPTVPQQRSGAPGLRPGECRSVRQARQPSGPQDLVRQASSICRRFGNGLAAVEPS